MVRLPRVPLLLALLCVPTPAFAADLTVNVFDHQLGAGLRPTSIVSFPDYDQDYSSVILTLQSFNPCEMGVDGDEWDRTAYIYVEDEHDNLIQIARWLTPYWNLPFTWTIDITQMQSVLHGDRKIFVDVGARHAYSLTLELTYGTPERLPVRTTTSGLERVEVPGETGGQVDGPSGGCGCAADRPGSAASVGLWFLLLPLVSRCRRA